MYALLLQDWVTIRSGSGSAVTQGEAAWLDMSEFLDVMFFIETKNFTTSAGSLMMGFQTAPTKDEVLFQNMNDVSSAGTPIALGVQTFVLLRDTALCPLARWLRWQLAPAAGSGATSFESTFRIWVAANQPGGYAHTNAATFGDQQGAGGPAWTPAPAVAGTAPQSAPGSDHRLATQSNAMIAPGGRSRNAMDMGTKVLDAQFKRKPSWRTPEKMYTPTPRSRVPFLEPGTIVSTKGKR